MAGLIGECSFGTGSLPGKVWLSYCAWICPRFPSPDESDFSAQMQASRDHCVKVATPVGLVSSFVLAFVLGSGWQSSLQAFHRMNNCITVGFYSIPGLWYMLPSVRHPYVLDWTVLLWAIHYASYQSLNYSRTAVLLGSQPVEHTPLSEAKILLYLMMVMAGSLFVPVDLFVHAAICSIFPTIYLFESLILGTPFDASGLAQVSIGFYTISLMMFLAARRNDIENRRSFIETKQQHRRTREILDLLSAVFDACFLVNAKTSEILEHNVKLNHMFQQDMYRSCLSEATGSVAEAIRFKKYLATVHTHSAQQMSICFKGAQEKFEASVIGTKLISADGCLLIGIQRLSSEREPRCEICRWSPDVKFADIQGSGNQGVPPNIDQVTELGQDMKSPQRGDQDMQFAAPFKWKACDPCSQSSPSLHGDQSKIRHVKGEASLASSGAAKQEATLEVEEMELNSHQSKRKSTSEIRPPSAGSSPSRHGDMPKVRHVKGAPSLSSSGGTATIILGMQNTFLTLTKCARGKPHPATAPASLCGSSNSEPPVDEVDGGLEGIAALSEGNDTLWDWPDNFAGSSQCPAAAHTENQRAASSDKDEPSPEGFNHLNEEKGDSSMTCRSVDGTCDTRLNENVTSPPGFGDKIQSHTTAGAALDAEPDDSGIPSDASEMTCLMIKNIPIRCTQQEILDAVEEVGFGDRYNFFYLPLAAKAKMLGMGYVFIGFYDGSVASEFASAITGYRYKKRNSNKLCEVAPAKMQGIQNNMDLSLRPGTKKKNNPPIWRTKRTDNIFEALPGPHEPIYQ